MADETETQAADAAAPSAAATFENAPDTGGTAIDGTPRGLGDVAHKAG